MMPIDKPHMQFYQSSDHTDKRTKSRNFLCPTSSQGQDASSVPSSAQDKGKRSASHQKNERAVGVNGKPLEKLKLASVSTREHPVGMLGGDDQASTSGSSGSERAIANYLVIILTNKDVRDKEKIELINEIAA